MDNHDFKNCPVCNTKMRNSYYGIYNQYLKKQCFNVTHTICIDYSSNDMISSIWLSMDGGRYSIFWDFELKSIIYRIDKKEIEDANWSEPIFNLNKIKEKINIINVFI